MKKHNPGWEETTIQYSKKLQRRYRYFESGHKCGIKVKPQNIERRIRCNCTVSYQRIPRPWYKLYEKIIIKLDKIIK